MRSLSTGGAGVLVSGDSARAGEWNIKYQCSTHRRKCRFVPGLSVGSAVISHACMLTTVFTAVVQIMPRGFLMQAAHQQLGSVDGHGTRRLTTFMHTPCMAVGSMSAKVVWNLSTNTWQQACCNKQAMSGQH